VVIAPDCKPEDPNDTVGMAAAPSARPFERRDPRVCGERSAIELHARLGVVAQGANA
jgi:hypothetical protein